MSEDRMNNEIAEQATDGAANVEATAASDSAKPSSGRSRKKGAKKKSGLSTGRKIAFVVLFLIGSGVLLYPTISNLWNQYLQYKTIGQYSETVETMTDDQKDEIWAAAKAFNDQHEVNIIMDAFNDSDDYVITHPYDSLLDPLGNGVMGYIEIAKINVKIAIHHGISAMVLEQGAGHIEGTSLPIGGESTHAVISAHRGLPSAKLFTDLDQMEVGDQFLIYVMDEVFAYEVDQIKTVLPEETNELQIVPGEDLVTLVTCTPYGVNTHRLLVRGHRVPYVPGENEVEDIWEKMSELKFAIITLLAVLLIADLLFLFMRRKRKKEEEERRRNAQPNQNQQRSRRRRR